MNEITLYVFPDKKGSTFDYYEDDGVSFEHLNGKYSIARISAKKEKNESIIDVGETEGDFEGKVIGRLWNKMMHRQV